ncbi:MAG: hypothetical protein WAW41_14320 [Methylobacter sp.]
MYQKKYSVLGAATVLLTVFGSTGVALADAAATPATLPKPVISSTIPLQVPPRPAGLSPTDSRPYFDVFSWETFLALNWPAKQGARGVPVQPNKPSVFLKASNTTPLVWGSYKEAYELFGTGTKTPTPWSSFDVPVDPCGTAAPSIKRLTKVTKPDNLVDEVNQAFSYPLIDQNKNYVYAEVRFNQSYYDYVLNNGYYLLKNLAVGQRSKTGIVMPASAAPNTPGAMMLKASWRQLIKGKDDFSRYYVVNAQVLNPDTKTCSTQTMGLVGFHIGYKLAEFPQWIWSTFEQVDNVQRGHGASSTTPISFNNGTDDPKTVGGYADRPDNQAPPLQPVDQRVSAQITRYNPIPTTPAGTSTVDLNNVYQAVLKGTAWEFYELVMTQWPSNPTQYQLMENGGVYPQDAGGAFPVNGAINTSMESFVQSPEDAAGAGGNSCMSCHYRASQSDFSWALQGRAH